MGSETNDHANVMGFPERSLEPLPFKDTVAPTKTVWLGPALATGATSVVLMVTCEGALLSPSAETISCTT